MKENILITGGAGYIGSVLVPILLDYDYEVTVLDNYYYNQSSLISCCSYDNFKIVRGDCRDHKLMKSLINNNQIIIPLAALVGAPLCDFDKIGAKSINEDAINLICSITSSEHKIIMPVSNSGYGIGEEKKIYDENSPLNPISVYGLTKVNAEKAIMQRKNSISLRLATVFGLSPRMRLDLLVNDFTYRAYRDKSITLFESHFKRNYIHIKDVSYAIVHSIENFHKMKGNIYNVGLDDANLSKYELCLEIQKQIPDFVFLESEFGEDPDKRNYIVSNQKILNTGFKPKMTIQNGISELIKSFSILKNSNYSNI